MTLITMFDPSSHLCTSVSARLGPRILCPQLATNRLSMSIVHYSILFPPRYIGTTQDLLRTSLLFRIHYPYTVHTVQCTYCTYSLISNTFSIQNQHCESRKKLWQRDKWQLVGCTTNILLIFFVCLLTLLKNIQTALEVGQLGPLLGWGPFKFWQGHRGLGDHLLPFK